MSIDHNDDIDLTYLPYESNNCDIQSVITIDTNSDVESNLSQINDDSSDDMDIEAYLGKNRNHEHTPFLDIINPIENYSNSTHSFKLKDIVSSISNSHNMTVDNSNFCNYILCFVFITTCLTTFMVIL
ncbi:hypothetical protein Catovirus_2_157 [Catovirus CTV1]|uniref:Uncharacterized protein n=1 Tax=Catovirus CTV1 TaxID=1977631 RepID=A0A1V0SC28_9VIRU|nr:hypothetical protein Catovirus_2_157 [Catovirus CTV1]